MSSAENNRNAMPVIASVVDELRALGIDVQVLYVSENGQTRGKPPRHDNAFSIPKNYRKPVGGFKP